jgi:MYXO-CTERM domain-containing protein
MKASIVIAGVVAFALLASSPASAAIDCTQFPCHPDCQGFCGAPCDTGCFIDGDGTTPGDGNPTKWATDPIKYKVNITELLAADSSLKKADVLAAIDAAMKTYEGVTCTNIKFKYEGEATATAAVDDHILIYFKNDPSDDTLYWIFQEMKPQDMNQIKYGLIQLNCTPNHPKKYIFDWTTKGKVANKIDIQTFITYALPTVIGFQVGPADKLPWSYDYVKHDLCQAHQDMVAFHYFDSGASGCTKPTGMKACGTSQPAGDPKLTEAGVPVKEDSGTTQKDTGGGGGTEAGGGGNEAGVSGEPGTQPAPEDDDGCCRVSHARTTSTPYLALVGLGILLLLGWRRRRK